jgi:hypothetical protein
VYRILIQITPNMPIHEDPVVSVTGWLFPALPMDSPPLTPDVTVTQVLIISLLGE